MHTPQRRETDRRRGRRRLCKIEATSNRKVQRMGYDTEQEEQSVSQNERREKYFEG